MRLVPLAALACVLATGSALAAPCYIIYDRNDTVVYRDYDPPFDLSDAKAVERGMLRRQGQHLLIAEFENCNPVGYISASTGGTAATVDEIVMQLRPAIGTSVTGNGSPQAAPITQAPGRQPPAVTVTTGGGGYGVR